MRRALQSHLTSGPLLSYFKSLTGIFYLLWYFLLKHPTEMTPCHILPDCLLVMVAVLETEATDACATDATGILALLNIVADRKLSSPLALLHS